MKIGFRLSPLLAVTLLCCGVCISGCNEESEAISEQSRESGSKEESTTSKPTQKEKSTRKEITNSRREKAKGKQRGRRRNSVKSRTDLHASPLPNMPEHLIGKDIIATVNGKPVEGYALQIELKKIQRKGAKISEERLSRIKRNILKRLVEEELFRQAIEDNKISVAKSKVDAEYAKYRKRFKSATHFDNYLKQGKRTELDIRDEIKEKLAMEKLILTRGTMSVSKEEAMDFYEKNKRFYLEKEAVRARHILIKVKSGKPGTPTEDPDEEEKALSKINEARKALKRRSFASVAREYSQGPTAAKGGDLGFFGRGQMVKLFEDEAFSMKPGDVSEPVRTRFGYHLIKLMAKRRERQQPFQEVKDKIYESLTNKKFFQSRRELLESLREEAKIVEYTR